MSSLLLETNLWDRYNLQGKISQANVLTRFVVAGGRFLSYWNHQLIKFEEEKILDFKNNFVIMKNER